MFNDRNNLASQFLRTLDKNVNSLSHKLAGMVRRPTLSNMEINFISNDLIDLGCNREQIRVLRLFLFRVQARKRG